MDLPAEGVKNGGPMVDRNSQTMQNFLARAIRLYEQEPGETSDSSRLGVYVQRWVR